MLLRPPKKPPCPWLNCPREEPPPPPGWIRSVLLDLWLAGWWGGGVESGTKNSPAETLFATPSGGDRLSAWWRHRAVPSRADPLSASVPVAVYAAVLLMTALIHQSQLRSSLPGGSRTPLHSTLISSFFCYSPHHESRKNGVAIVNIPGGLSAWCAPPLVRLRHAERPVSPVTSLR